jgi:hypothetical protein
VLLGEAELLAHHLDVDVDLVGDADGRDLCAVLPQLLDPRWKVLVRLLARHIEAEDARVRLVVVSGVHRVEALLAGGVPEVDLDGLAVDLCIVPEQCQRVRRQHARLVLLHQEALDELRLADSRVSQQNDFEGILALGVCGGDVARVEYGVGLVVLPPRGWVCVWRSRLVQV